MRSALVIISPDPPIVVLDRLNTAFNHRTNSRIRDVAYRGDLWDRGFRINRRPVLLDLGDPPVVCGRIAPFNGGTKVELQRRYESGADDSANLVVALHLHAADDGCVFRAHIAGSARAKFARLVLVASIPVLLVREDHSSL